MVVGARPPPSPCGIWCIFMPMICSVQLLTKRDAKAAAEEDSLQKVKIVMIYFFVP
jgi:hypothetical protein